ncbi:hypothetical protein ACLZX5_02375 [Enterococcus faecium]
MDDKQKMYEKNRKHSEALNFRVDKKTYLELTLIAKQREFLEQTFAVSG